MFINNSGRKREAFLYYQLIPKEFHYHLAVPVCELLTAILFGPKSLQLCNKEWQSIGMSMGKWTCAADLPHCHKGLQPCTRTGCARSALRRSSSFSPAFLCVAAFYSGVSPCRGIVTVHNDPISRNSYSPFPRRTAEGKWWLWNKQGHHLVAILCFHSTE